MDKSTEESSEQLEEKLIIAWNEFEKAIKSDKVFHETKDILHRIKELTEEIEQKKKKD